MLRRSLLRVAFAGALLTATRAGAVVPPFPGVVTTTFTSPDDAAAIPDGNSLISTLTVGGLTGKIVDVDVTLDVTHTQNSQLVISLIAPSGKTVTLTSNNGGANDDVFSATTFDDQAPGTPSAPNVRNFTYADRVPTGPIQPEEALGALAGGDPNGLWALVVLDDTNGQTGTLHGWSLAISTLPVFRPGPPATFTGTGGNIPSNNPTGLRSSVDVSGLGSHVYDVNVTVDVRHPNSGDLNLFLTSPSGRRIDLVTHLGGGNDDLYAGTTFDDQAGTPIGDLPLPPNPTAFTTVVPEGALSAFLGEDPNGTWTLTAVDDIAGNSGRLNGWTLALSGSTCGDGVVDPGEACDDGNAVAGDGCEPDCTLTTSGGCPGCATSELDCDDCRDDDGNGLVDTADPACQASDFGLTTGSLVFPAGPGRAVLKFAGVVAPPPAPGPASLVIADGNGPVACASLGTLTPSAGGLSAKGQLAGGSVTVKIRAGGRVSVRGTGLGLTALDDHAVTLGLRLGSGRFMATGTFRARGRTHWVYP